MILTVAIPTYNRPAQLECTLKALEKQTVQDFSVYISDNASAYDTQALIDQFPSEFRSRIVLHRHQTNTLIDFNVLSLFACCKTKWMWTLADDDKIFESSVETILDAISREENTGIFDFSSIEESANQSNSVMIDSLSDLVDDQTEGVASGSLIFLSSKVYNMERLKPALPYLFEYSYTHISTAILIARAVELHIPYLRLPQYQIVRHNSTVSTSWSLGRVALGTRTCLDIPFELDAKRRVQLNRLLVMDAKTILIYSITHPAYGAMFLRQMYDGAYQYLLPGRQKAAYRILTLLLSWKVTRKLVKKVFIWNRKRKGMQIEDGWN